MKLDLHPDLRAPRTGEPESGAGPWDSAHRVSCGSLGLGGSWSGGENPSPWLGRGLRLSGRTEAYVLGSPQSDGGTDPLSRGSSQENGGHSPSSEEHPIGKGGHNLCPEGVFGLMEERHGFPAIHAEENRTKVQVDERGGRASRHCSGCAPRVRAELRLTAPLAPSGQGGRGLSCVHVWALLSLPRPTPSHSWQVPRPALGLRPPPHHGSGRLHQQPLPAPPSRRAPRAAVTRTRGLSCIPLPLSLLPPLWALASGHP